MTRTNGLKVFFVAALGALAMLALPAVAGAKDRNHDRIPDRWEKRHHLSLHRSQAGRDQDRDHLRNRAEFMAGDNPRDADTDNDGVKDGDENAGTIQSFDQETGKLTIALFGGDTISGVVNEGTEIECDGHATPPPPTRAMAPRPGTTNSRATTKVSTPETTKEMTPKSTMAKSPVTTTVEKPVTTTRARTMADNPARATTENPATKARARTTAIAPPPTSPKARS